MKINVLDENGLPTEREMTEEEIAAMPQVEPTQEPTKEELQAILDYVTKKLQALED